ncbi:MAG TPA: 4-hydroxy-tetrahydrodipicolinate reductase [Planktothrix sp.]|jgi:4-hydroxy-tetrahydrodipicolinate reductase
MIKVCVAGATGWTGGAVAKGILQSKDFQLVGAVARAAAGKDAGEVLGNEKLGVTIEPDLEKALSVPTDVLIEYTTAKTAKQHVLQALEKNVRVVIGSSGLTASDFAEIEKICKERNLGVIAAGNFSITAALAKKFALLAAQYLPTWEIIDYADPHKPDAPSGTARELADQMAQVKANEMAISVDKILGAKEARGATIGGAQVHSVRLPGYKFAFDSLFGLPDERLTIKHDAGASAMPYVAGTLLAAQKVMTTTGLIRGMDKLLFDF